MAAKVEWRMENERLKAYVNGTPVAWAPQPGSQEAFLRCPIYETLLAGNRGGGKGLPVGEPVLTPTGEKPIESLMVGDVVCCPDGTNSKIIGVYPQGYRPTYKISFTDGSVARCDDQHKWFMRCGDDPTYGPRVMTMQEVLKKQKRRLQVPVLDNLTFKSSALKIDPYILGLLLGDGSFGVSGNLQFGTADVEIAQAAAIGGLRPGKVDGNYHYFTARQADILHTETTKLGLKGHRSWEKFIPKEYLMASKSDRIALLQGLLDSDGTISRVGSISFASTSEKLTKGVRWLVRSLGGNATTPPPAKVYLNGTRYRDSYNTCILTYNKFKPFRLERKAIRVKKETMRGPWRTVKNIVYAGDQETICIKIAHPTGLFLTRDLLVTHNTDALLFDFAQEVGRGFGAEWKGILFRRTYPELDDVILKAQKWFNEIWPKDGPNPATYNQQSKTWTWKSGEILKFRHMLKEKDYYEYHGHSFSWIGWEELTTWPDSGCYTRMMSCCRSSHPAVAKKSRVRSTTNPYGVGHNWVKRRFQLPIAEGMVIGRVIRDSVNKSGDLEEPRVTIRSSLAENKILLIADPQYLPRLRMSARNPAELAAWIDGSWDITCGGMFDDLWNMNTHIIPNIPYDILKSSGWKLNRAYDHGQSKPFSVGWWAQSNGNPIELQLSDKKIMEIGSVKGDLILFDEWYGWNGEMNEGLRMPASKIATGILQREEEMALKGLIKRGPADDQIFAKEDGATSPASRMRSEKLYWDRAGKGANSRPQGWERIREYLTGAIPDEDGYREEPGLFVCRRCAQWLKTVPCLPRDEAKLDDVNTKVEDHCGDMTRYRVRWSRNAVGRRKW